MSRKNVYEEEYRAVLERKLDGVRRPRGFGFGFCFQFHQGFQGFSFGFLGFQYRFQLRHHGGDQTGETAPHEKLEN